ncbi:MAG: patatin-like phospholipase family protein [Burkholderiaceae bacterium]|nr:MAG: patatin-like phospholipase family protein [Burkholderiaceae bacterium]
MSSTGDSPRNINLALQGGGSYGAFTWGVLDALLEDGRLSIEAITGASAGAMNAVALADGWLRNPADPRSGAREGLEKFWRAVAETPGFASFTNPTLDSMTGNFSLGKNPAFIGFDLLSRLASPYQLNPLNLNPLRGVLDQQIDFERINAQSTLQLYVCATNVRSGRVKVFGSGREDGLTTDCLLASACLPFAFQAVEIKGEHYWDGGYMGNPALFPLFNATIAPDILLVQINPLIRDTVPDTASEIIDRTNEISFNATLMMEMRAIEFVQRLINDGQLRAKDSVEEEGSAGQLVRRVLRREHPKSTAYKRIFMHLIEGGKYLQEFGASAKYNSSWVFLCNLRDTGREAARHWLQHHLNQVGVKSSIDIAKTFL